jgi:photosystem II stability/assembly factor-like uncharacterized protein
MRRLASTLAAIILIGLSQSASAQTWQVPHAAGGKYLNGDVKRIVYVSATQAWAVTSAQLLLTMDGGLTWVPQKQGSSFVLESIHFVSPTKGWACGANRIYTTSNGTTWASSVFSGTCYEVYGMSATNAVAVGTGGAIATTSNGGGSWFGRTSNTTQNLFSVYFASATHGWAVGSNGAIVMSADGGVTWSTQTSGTTAALNSVAFSSVTDGWAAGASGVLLHTTDGGGNWQTVSTGSAENFNGIRIRSASELWLTGDNGTLLLSTDGGTNWAPVSTGTTNKLYDIAFNSGSSGILAGAMGLTMTTSNDGGSWNTSTSGVSNNLNGVHFVTPLLGWAVGDLGTIINTTDGGYNWTLQTSGSTARLNKVFFASATTGWAVGTGGVILSTINGGDTWTAQTSNTTQQLFNLSFVSATTGWVVGDGGVVRTTNNGGATWTTQSVGGGPSLLSVYFISPSQGWISGQTISGGAAYVTTNGGVNWTAQNVNSTNAMWGINFVSATQGWAVGSNASLRTTNDGGSTWTTQAAGISSNLNAVYMADATTGWIAGISNLSATSDGVNWAAQPVEQTPNFASISFSGSTGCMVGGGGLVTLYKAASVGAATAPGTICAGASITVSYKSTPMFSNNVYTLQLSDANGSFASPVTLSTLTAINGGLLQGTIPVGTASGTNYRLRVIASSPVESSDPGLLLTVYAKPGINTVSAQTICAGSSTTAVNFSGTVPNSTFDWTNTNTTIGLAPTGSGAIGSFTGINTGTTNQTATITVTPSANGCTGTAASFQIIVKPKPAVNAITSQVRCNATATAAVSFSGGIAGTVYGWTNNNTAIGLAGSGNGNIGSFAATNTGLIQAIATITVTPSLNSCAGNPATFTYTVNPTLSAQLSYPGSPYILGTGTAVATLTGITGGTFSAPAGLSIHAGTGQIDLGLSQAGTYTVLYALAASGGCSSFSTSAPVTLVDPFSATISYPGSPYCASAGFAAVVQTGTTGGTYSSSPAGLVINSSTGVIDVVASPGGTYTVRYSGTSNFTETQVIIQPSQVVDVITNQSVCAGVSTSIFNVHPIAGITTTWTNSNTAIGLVASGNGNLPSFLAQNAGTGIVSSTISVQPSGGTGCSFKPMIFQVNVKPVPQISSAPANQILCANRASAPVLLTSVTAGTTITWTNTNSAIGLTSAGAGSIASFATQNNSSTPQTGNFVATPSMAGCSGTPVSFSITTHPNIDSIVYQGSPFCQAGTVSPVYYGSKGGSFSATPAGLSINAVSGAIALGSSAPGNYLITYTVNASNGCAAVATRSITIRAQSGVNAVNNQIYCNNIVTTPIVFVGPNVAFSWTNDNPSIGLPASGAGNLPSFTSVNNGPTVQYANIRVYPQGNGSTFCPGKVMGFRYQVNYCGPIAQHGDTGGENSNARVSASISVSPNPLTSIAVVQLSGAGTGSWYVQALNRFGIPTGVHATMTNNRATIDLSNLTPGVYILQLVNTRTGLTYQKQVIKF